MKKKIAILALALLLVPASTVMAQSSVSIYETLVADGNFKTLTDALDKANIQELKVMPGPFTFFAPNDAAFAKLPKETFDRIVADQQILKNILYYHIVPGKYTAKDLPALKQCKTLCPTTEPEVLKFQKTGEGFMVINANIVKADVQASNGVIHVIDAVLMPKFAPPKTP